jgi:alpha-mannosidase
VSEGALEGAIRVTFTWRLPEGKEIGEYRSRRMVKIPITIIVTLRKDSPLLFVTVQLKNNARDHRLRVLFPSGIRKAINSTADGQFDVLSRPIKLPDAKRWKEPPYATHPMWNFVDVSDNEGGFAVINDGLIEYEVKDDEQRTIAITLLRAFGKFVFGRLTPDAQCLGEHYYRFAIFPHSGNWHDTDIFQLTARHIVPLQAIQSAPTRGGAPTQCEFLHLSPTSLVFSGIKQSEEGKGLILRLWNPLEKEEKATLETEITLREANLLTMEEKPLKSLDIREKRMVFLPVSGKKIVTIGLHFN